MNHHLLKAKTTYLALALLLLAGCGKDRQADEPVPSVAETELLLAYLEDNGNLLNSEYIPALIDADAVYQRLVAQNMHVIDVRPAEEFAAGHIAHSLNVTPEDILHHFEQRIQPTSFEQIVLVCNDAMLSGYVAAVLTFLGYDNVAALRFGLSIWDEEIAKQHWLAVLSDHLHEKQETTYNPKSPAGQLPALATGHNLPYHILRQQAKELLKNHSEGYAITIAELMENPNDYYIINYWPEPLYNRGHLPGAIQYTPKASLHSSAYLNTLPIDKPVVLYCFTGNHSVYASVFLNLLGYEAYSLMHGANSFIHSTIRETEGPGRWFTEDRVLGLPLSGKDGETDHLPAIRQEQEEPVPVIGGC